MNFVEEYEKMSSADKSDFRNTLNNLLYQCFITKMRYDRNTSTDKINYDYTFIEKHFSLFEDYLSYMDVALEVDENLGVYYTRSLQNKNHLRIDTATTLLVYALRSYYDKKIAENPNQTRVFMNSSTLKMTLKDLGLSTANKKITSQQLAMSLRLLSNYNIVLKCEHNFYDINFSFFILPPIKFCINPEKVNLLRNKLSSEEIDTDENAEVEDLQGIFGENE